MDADRYRERIEEYLDDALSRPEQAEMADHVRSCPECRAEVEAHRKLLRLGLAAEPVTVPDDLGPRIRERLSGPMRRARRRRILRPVLRSAVAAAAAAVLLVAIYPRDSAVDRVLTPIRHVAPSTTLLADWLDQARNTDPSDAGFLAEEARALDLLPAVKAALDGAHGAERRYLLAAEDLLIQLLNDPSPGDLAHEARAVAKARRP
ncbi:MAG: anti-sigma factor family protein [Planctomycetota bacterium]|jgi:hypothetical protein